MLVAVGSVLILFTNQELFALLTLILIIIGLSALYFLQGAPLVAIIQLILHAGGILVLLICSLLFFKPKSQGVNKNKLPHKKEAAMVFIAVCFVLYLGNKLRLFSHQFNLPSSNMSAGTVQELGYQILGPYGLILELISILLLTSLVAMLYIVKQSYRPKNR